jgi:hypothetical protein
MHRVQVVESTPCIFWEIIANGKGAQERPRRNQQRRRSVLESINVKLRVPVATISEVFETTKRSVGRAK